MEKIIQPLQNHIIMEFENSETTGNEQDLSAPVEKKPAAFLAPRMRKWLIRSAVAITILIVVAIAGIFAYTKTVTSFPTASMQEPSPETSADTTLPITASELAAQVPETVRYPVEADPTHQPAASNSNIPDTQVSPTPDPTPELAELIQSLKYALQRADDATLIPGDQGFSPRGKPEGNEIGRPPPAGIDRRSVIAPKPHPETYRSH